MIRGTHGSPDCRIESDESSVLAYLRGLPDNGSPWSRALNGSRTGGNANPNTMLVAAGFDKATATLFACDTAAWREAYRLSTTGAQNVEQGKPDGTSVHREGGRVR